MLTECHKISSLLMCFPLPRKAITLFSLKCAVELNLYQEQLFNKNFNNNLKSFISRVTAQHSLSHFNFYLNAAEYEN